MISRMLVAGDGTVLSLAMDLAASAFAICNVANMLVMESAFIWGTFMWFHEQIATSIDRMTEVLVKEQVVAQKDLFVSFNLLEKIAEALERSSPCQVEVVLMEGLVVEEMEVVEVEMEVVAAVRGHPSVSLPPLSSPPVHMYSPSSPLYYLQGPYLKPTTSRPHSQLTDSRQLPTSPPARTSTALDGLMMHWDRSM
jgi:hypothetical protein